MENTLEKLKKDYERLRARYKLMDFSKLNQEFEVEKIQERETDFILREMRRVISDKIAAFLRFLELFINPQSAPVFVLASLKELSSKDKETIEKMYRELVNIELTAVSLDIEYSEAKEAQFIKDTVKKWQDIKPDMKNISDTLLKMQSKSSEKKGKSYFG